MATITLDIYSPTRIVFSDTISSLSVPTVNGIIGVLPHHIPLFTTLTEGEIKVTTAAKTMFLAIGGGFMEVTKSHISILVSRAFHADELNEAEFNKARLSAQEIIKNKGKGKELSDAQALLRRSTLELKVLKRRTHRPEPILRNQ